MPRMCSCDGPPHVYDPSWCNGGKDKVTNSPWDNTPYDISRDIDYRRAARRSTPSKPSPMPPVGGSGVLSPPPAKPVEDPRINQIRLLCKKYAKKEILDRQGVELLTDRWYLDLIEDISIILGGEDLSA